jgi:hypothetical protein
LPEYLYCGITIRSNIAISELPVSAKKKAEISFNLKPASKHATKQHWLFHWYSANGDIILSFCKQGLSSVLGFPGLADYLISEDTKRITCRPTPGTSRATIRHLLLDQVLPRCLAYHEKIMVHASAVKLEHGLILFLGDSGSGKSTLAGNFHQAGQPAVSDDCLWIKETRSIPKAIPCYEGLRLWEDSLQVLFPTQQKVGGMAHYSLKKRVPLGRNDVRISQNETIIQAMFVLAPPRQTTVSEIILEKLSNREAFIALLRQSFQLNLMDRERISWHLRALKRIVLRLPAYSLAIPHNYDLLPLVHQRILETLSGQPKERK